MSSWGCGNEDLEFCSDPRLPKVSMEDTGRVALTAQIEASESGLIATLLQCLAARKQFVNESRQEISDAELNASNKQVISNPDDWVL